MLKNHSAAFVHALFSEMDLAKRWEDFAVNEEKGLLSAPWKPGQRLGLAGPYPGSAAAIPPKALLIFNTVQGRGET